MDPDRNSNTVTGYSEIRTLLLASTAISLSVRSSCIMIHLLTASGGLPRARGLRDSAAGAVIQIVYRALLEKSVTVPSGSG